ncbi:MAG: RusA family crossover junction endodeoxyribonuclease [bacterium]
MRTELNFAVPLIPPSVNHYKTPNGRGGWFRTRETTAFIEAVCVFSHKQPVPGAFYEVEVTFYLPQNRFLASDADNFSKVTLDALKVAGVIRDDRYITDHIIHKRTVPDARDSRTEYLVRGKEEP